MGDRNGFHSGTRALLLLADESIDPNPSRLASGPASGAAPGSTGAARVRTDVSESSAPIAEVLPETVVQAVARLAAPGSPAVRDAFDRAGQPYTPCRDVDELCEQIAVGAAALVLAEARVDERVLECLEAFLRSEPAWSDLALVVVSPEPRSPRATFIAERFERAVFVRESSETDDLVKAVRRAVRGRLRQYAVRDRLTEQASRLAEADDAAGVLRLTREAVGGVHYQIDQTTGRVERDGGLYELIGFHPEEAEPTTMWWRSRVHPDDIAAVGNHLAGGLDDRADSSRLKYRVRRRDGSYAAVLDRAAVVRDEHRRVARRVGLVSEVEPEAGPSHGELQQAIDAGNTGVWDWDVAGGAIKWSGRTADIFGMTADEFDGRPGTIARHIHPDDAARVRRSVEATLAGGQALATELRVVRRDGERRWVSCSGRATFDADGRPLRMLGTVYDVTDRRRVQEELSARAEQQSVVASLGQMALAGADERSVMDAATAGVARTLGVDFSAVLQHRPGQDVFHFRSAFGWPARLTESGTIPVADSQAGYTLATGGPVVVDDVREETRFRFHSVTDECRVVSGISVLVPGRTVPYGLLSAHTNVRRAFSVDDVNFLKSVANVIAAAVEGAETRGALRDSEDRLRMAIHGAALGTFNWEPQSGRLLWNDTCKSHFGLTADAEVTIEAFFDLLHSDDRGPTREAIQRALGSHTQFDTDYRAVAPDGSVRWIRAIGGAIYDTAGVPRQFNGITIDVTERKVSEQALREINERYRIIARATNDVIWEWNLVTDTVSWNEAFVTVFGYDPDAAVDMSADWKSLIHPDDVETVWGGIRRVISGVEHLWADEYRFRKADGSYAVVFDRGYVHRDEAGNPLHMIGSMIDLTERKRAEAELKRLNETLEQRVAERTAVAEMRAAQLREMALTLTQAEQRERRRLAQVLHDHLQQLLVAAKLRLGLTRPDRPAEEIAQSLKKVDDLLGQSIAASRSLTVELSPPVLYDRGFVAGLSWLARRMADDHGLTVEVVAGPDVDPPIDEVGAMLFQATRELLFNVVKHAGVARATVTATRYGDTLAITVEDAGRGFDSRARVGDRGEAGGFGLFSVRERIGLFGGNVAIESHPDAGTCVTINIPLRPTAEPAEAETPPANQTAGRRATPFVAGQRVRVLLADDHKILREGIAGLLREEADIEIVGEATDGQMVVDLARELAPDVIVMDITMPRLNGIEATRRILKDAPGVRVIGLSMHEIDSMASAILDAGAVAYLTKGGPVEALVAAIRTHAPATDA